MDNDTEFQRRYEDKLSVRERLLLVETNQTNMNKLLEEVRANSLWTTRFLFGVLVTSIGTLATTIFALSHR